jgi:hypothetical protein
MNPTLRKLNLTAHIASSVGWLGAAAAFLALAITNLASRDIPTVRAAYVSMELIGWTIIVPLSIGSLLTGVAHSLGTRWGLFRHYWVLLKLMITVFSTLVLLMFMRTFGKSPGAAPVFALSHANLGGLRMPAALTHSGIGLLFLILATALSVYKPWGLTRFGRRAHREQQAPGSDNTVGEEVSRQSFDIGVAILAILMLVFLVLHLIGGGHGRHLH